MVDIRTVNHGESDHYYIACTRVTKSLVTLPHYKLVRQYSKIDPVAFRAILWASDELRLAATLTDPDEIAAASQLYSRFSTH